MKVRKPSLTITLSIAAITAINTLAFSPLAVHATDYQTTTVTYPYYGFVEDPEHPWDTVWDALDSTDTIEYSDEFFNDPSPGDHPELRAMSYALALAGYENKADGYPSTETIPNPKLTNLLNQLGFSDYQSWDVSSEQDGHSMGTTIGHKTLASGQELVVVAPRNYNYMTEWLSNFNTGTTGDHAGFNESADFIVSHLNQYLSDRNLEDYKLWIVGYSRGGAVVDLVAKKINDNLTDYDLQSDDFYAYTFGAPRASLTETKYQNIHDVKDGNDLLLGYVFPEAWGFYNTGVYEEIHPADLTITTSVIDITDLADGDKAMSLLATNNGLTQDIDTINGKAFMDEWFDFIIENGFTREYFDTEVKAPLSNLMQAYQSRTIDKQSDFLNFLQDINKGVLGMIASNALIDFMTGGYESLNDFPPYQDIVKVLRGTATDADIDDFLDYLIAYAGEYEDYEERMGAVPAVTASEFAIIKENVPKLIKALSPFIIADARYTREVYGENYSLYYTYTLVSNASTLVVGHIPESIMPILKSLIPEKTPEDEPSDDPGIIIPNTGMMTKEQGSVTKNLPLEQIVILTIISVILAVKWWNKSSSNQP